MIIRDIQHKNRIVSPDDVARVGLDILKAERDGDDMKEHFWVVGLNSDNRIRYIELASLGTLNASLVHPREVFALAITKRVASLILMHNHPSGNTEPSAGDVAITEQLKQAGTILGIPIRDHVIIGTAGKYNNYTSFAKLGYL